MKPYWLNLSPEFRGCSAYTTVRRELLSDELLEPVIAGIFFPGSRSNPPFSGASVVYLGICLRMRRYCCQVYTR
jgi:hypothetical protein